MLFLACDLNWLAESKLTEEDLQLFSHREMKKDDTSRNRPSVQIQ